ncbi:MAG: PrsW family glutamic-type intramembrane protease [bacterium JZ-2024 1]
MPAQATDIGAPLALSLTLALVILGSRRFKSDFTIGGILAVLAGVVAVFPSVWLEALLGAPYPEDLIHAPVFVRLLHSFVLSALIEEFFKFVSLWTLFRQSPLFRQKSTAILLGMLLGIGFGGLEGLNRALALPAAPSPVVHILVPLWLIPFTLHLITGAVMGFLFYRASQEVLPSSETRNLLLALFIPVIFHGVYNFVASSPSEVAWIGSSLVVIAGAFIVALGIAEARTRSDTIGESVDATDVLESYDPVRALIELPLSSQLKTAIAQELLARNGVTGYSIVSLLRASDGILTFKAIWLKDFRVCAVKLFSPSVVMPAGVERFRRLFERLRETAPACLLSYREFFELPRFLVVVRDFGIVTLSDYVSGLLTREERVDLALQILAIVKEIWQKDLYHGRLTPQNFVFWQGRMALVDAGQALFTNDSDRHRAFVEPARASEPTWSFARDYRAVRSLLAWLAGDESILPMDVNLAESGSQTAEEPVEQAELALERYQVQSLSLARLLAERARRCLRQEDAGYTDIGIVALLRSLALEPRPELTQMLEHVSDQALAEAKEALMHRTPERALQSLARYMELRPDASEIAGAHLENITAALLKKGDYFLFRKGQPSIALRFYRAASALNPGATDARGRMALLGQTPLLPPAAIYQFLLLSAVLVLITLLVAHKVALQRPVVLMSRATPEGWRSAASLGTVPVLHKAWEASFRSPLSPFVLIDSGRVYAFTEKSAVAFSEDNGTSVGEHVLTDQYGETATVTAQPLVCNTKLIIPLKKVRGDETRYLVKIFELNDDRTGRELPVPGLIYGIGCWKDKAFIISSRAVQRIDLSEMKPDWKWSPEVGGITADGAVRGNLLFVPVGVPLADANADVVTPQEELQNEVSPTGRDETISETDKPTDAPLGGLAPDSEGTPSHPDRNGRIPEVPPGAPGPSQIPAGAILPRRIMLPPNSDANLAEPPLRPYVTALSIHSGQPIFRVDMDAQADYGLAVSGNFIVVASTGNTVTAYDLKTRALRWETGDVSVVQAPVIANNSVLITGNTRARILDLKTGAPRFETGLIYPSADALFAAPFFVVPSARPHSFFPSARIYGLTLIHSGEPSEIRLDLAEDLADATIRVAQFAQGRAVVIRRDGDRDRVTAFRVVSFGVNME